METKFITTICIFRLPGGITLFAEDVDLSGESVSFDLDRCAVLDLVPVPDGIQWASQKASRNPGFFGGQKIVVSKSALAWQDTTNLDLIATARQAITGIKIANGRR